MKVGEWVRFKHKRSYGVAIAIDDKAVRVLWQGLSCRTTWVPSWDLVWGLEDELMAFKGGIK